MKEKSRQTAMSLPISWYQTYVTTGLEVPNTRGDGNVAYTDSYEHIRYGQGRERYNPCEHFVYNKDMYANHVQCRYNGTPGDRWDHVDSPLTGGELTPGGYLDWLKSIANEGFGWHNFALRAVEAMTPTMETGFSLGNFIYEIREVKDLIHGWGQYRKKVMDRWSDISLNYNFGLRPFIADVISVAKAMLSFRERLAALKAGAGKLQVRHYSEKEKYVTASRDWQPNSNSEAVENVSIPTLKRTASMTYTYQMPDIDRANLELYAILDSVGLNLDPAIIWEALPYSFVVDWFINAGDFLHQYRRKWVPISIYIKDFGVSVKFSYHSDSRVRRIGLVASNWVDRSEVVGKYYYRRPMKLDDRHFWFTADNSGGLDLRRFHLGALLLRQRLK